MGSDEPNPCDPWTYARRDGRDYVKPEDIGDARDAGGGGEMFLALVLRAIADRRVEGVSLCAFVAIKERYT